jgi:hypothetical protein
MTLWGLAALVRWVFGLSPRALTRDEAIERQVAGMCYWCAGWERIAMSGEVGNCLDPLHPSYRPGMCRHMAAAVNMFEMSAEDLALLREATRSGVAPLRVRSSLSRPARAVERTHQRRVACTRGTDGLRWNHS